MKPTDTLSREHELIKRAIELLEEADRRLESGDDSVAGLYPELVDFITTFADRYHHGKEEDLLFRRLEERGMSKETGPLGVMTIEHQHGRAFVRDLAKACDRLLKGDESARAVIITSAEGYAGLLRGHIEKEDAILYPMADRLLTEDDQRELSAEFAEADERLGADAPARYERVLDEIERRLAA
jgi:hemerythrin-like domain-containing protein